MTRDSQGELSEDLNGRCRYPVVVLACYRPSSLARRTGLGLLRLVWAVHGAFCASELYSRFVGIAATIQFSADCDEIPAKRQVVERVRLRARSNWS